MSNIEVQSKMPEHNFDLVKKSAAILRDYQGDLHGSTLSRTKFKTISTESTHRIVNFQDHQKPET